MKNKEKCAERVLTFACDEGSFGVYEKTGEMERCTKMHCTECLFLTDLDALHRPVRKYKLVFQKGECYGSRNQRNRT